MTIEEVCKRNYAEFMTNELWLRRRILTQRDYLETYCHDNVQSDGLGLKFSTRAQQIIESGNERLRFFETIYRAQFTSR